LGQSSLVVLCAGSTLLLAPKPGTGLFSGTIAKVSYQQPSEVICFSYWSIKPWFHTNGKLTVVLIIPSSWGFPTGPLRHQDFFWCYCRGERKFLQGESLTSNLFTLLLFCLVSLLYFICFLFIKNTKK
jgi:hypothetical protein